MVRSGSRTETIGPLLDSMFGLFVWAAHFLIIYTVTATACQTILRYTNSQSRSGLAIALALVTVATAAIVVLHAVSRRRRFRGDPERQFRLRVTIGSSAVATVAIVWQLFAFVLVPLCA
jgi:hypothetical protein